MRKAEEDESRAVACPPSTAYKCINQFSSTVLSSYAMLLKFDSTFRQKSLCVAKEFDFITYKIKRQREHQTAYCVENSDYELTT